MKLKNFLEAVEHAEAAEYVIHYSMNDIHINQCHFIASTNNVSMIFSQHEALDCDELHFTEKEFHAAVAKVLMPLKNKGMPITMTLADTAHRQQRLPAMPEAGTVAALWEAFATGTFRQVIPSIASPSEAFQQAVIALSVFLMYDDAIALLRELSEANALSLVQEVPGNIQYIHKPTTNTAIAAIKGMLDLDPDEIPELLKRLGPDVAPEVVVAAISDTYHGLYYLEQLYGEHFLTDFPEALQRQAIEAEAIAITNIKNPSDALLMHAIKLCPGIISNFKNASPELEYLALTHGQKKRTLNFELLIDVWHGHNFSTEALDKIKPGLGAEYQRLKAFDVDCELATAQLIQFIATKGKKQQACRVELPTDI